MEEKLKEGELLKKTIQLEGGTKVMVRPIQPSDAEIEWNFVHKLSDQSKYLRFMSAVHDLTPSMLRYFTDIDLEKHMALIAVIEKNGKEAGIAVGRYFKYPDRSSCEFALVVADEWQGKGIGYQILSELIANARNRGIKLMEGEIFSLNKEMLTLVHDLGFKTSIESGDASLVRATLNLDSEEGVLWS